MLFSEFLIMESRKPSSGLSKKQKTRAVKKARKGEKFTKDRDSSFANISKGAAKKYGSKEAGDRVAGAIFWKNRHR